MQPIRKTKTLVLLAVTVLLTALIAAAGLSVAKSEPAAQAAACAVRISEIQASNAAFPDSDGVLRDWVELYNESSQPYDLSGCGLSDDALEIKYFFPAGTLMKAGERLVVSCDSTGANGSAPFGIARGGSESICFFTADDTLADSVVTVATGKGESYARTEKGWEILSYGTPGYENSERGFDLWLAGRGHAECSVVLSELMVSNGCTLPGIDGSFPDWIELLNSGKKDFDLSGWCLSQDVLGESGWRFSEGTVLQAGERLLLLCDGVNGPDFSLASNGEGLCLSAPDGTPAWNKSWERMDDDRALTLDEESGEYYIGEKPSPGHPNTTEGVQAAQVAQDISGELVINELQCSNYLYHRQTDGEYYDWLELCNRSDGPVLLSDYYLSDKADPAEAWQLPAVTLESGKTFLLICSGDESLSTVYYTHTPFALSAEEERLYLYNSDGELADFCYARDIPTDCSLGRMNGEKGWFYFNVPTPEETNGNGLRRAANAPDTGVEQGVYEGVKGLDVSLSAPGEIHYTLDGSTPTEDSPVYKNPIYLTETTVIRAVSYEKDCLPSAIATYSYIINEGHTLPVVSLATDPALLFGTEGIYYVPSKARDTREIPGNMAFFEENGCAQGDCSITLHGASSRNIRSKKSLKMTFRPRYGGHLKYDVFGDGLCSDYFSLVLRSGYMKDHTLLRDEVCTTAAMSVSDTVLSLRSRYCVVYLNGEYWGVYALRDAYSDTYAANRLGVREEGVFISRSPVRFSHNPELLQTYAILKRRGGTQEEKYRLAAETFDLETLADWMVLQAYFTNYDLPGNIRYIQTNEGEPWKIAFFDLDFGLRSKDVSWRYVMDPVNEFGNLTRTVLAQPEFQDLLFRRMAALYKNGLCEETLIGILNDYGDTVAAELEREYERWDEGRGDLAVTQAELTDFLQSNRQSRCLSELCTALDLDEAAVREKYFGGMELE